VLILTTFEIDEKVLRALRARGAGSSARASSRPPCSGSVRLVTAGEALLSPKATRGLVQP
jgi:DNA-binding NarL/FixJ family response regulator